MESEKILTINGIPYKCTFFTGYNSHYYCTVYDDRDGRYLGQIADIKYYDSNIKSRVSSFVNSL